MLVCIAGGVAHFHRASVTVPVLVSEKLETIFPAPKNSFVEQNLSSAELATNPPDAASAAGKILAADPADADGRIMVMLDELCRAGEFQTALKIAAAAPPELRADFLKTVFNHWAQAKPQDAVKSLEAITDPSLHSAALRAVADGWNTTAPGEVAAFAIALPAGEDRDYALGVALDNWSLQDPAGLATWLNTLPRGIEFDVGAAMMVTKTDGANRTPELAMHWVENITDPALKQDSMMRVLDEWAEADSAAAQQYVAGAAWLDDAQRQEILGKIIASR